MIFDILENAPGYFPLNDRFEKAFSFLMQSNLSELPEGTYEIDSDLIYAIVARDIGRSKDEALIETHERYIDIQFILGGVDEMGWLPRRLCKQPSAGYDSASDLQFYHDDPMAWFTAGPGSFAVFFPEDGHLPMISAGEIHKVVVKLAVAKD